MTTGELTGTVLAIQANYYRVSLDQPAEELLCIRRARLKKTNQYIYVGDRVCVEEPDWQGKRGAISAVIERRNLLDRPKIANVDRVLLVFALVEPDLDPYQISRFLVNIETNDLAISLCLSKRDLVVESDWQAWRDRLTSWGYEPTAISMETQEGIETLKQDFKPGVTVISGPSGVGKSTLINTLMPELNLRTNVVSQRQGHGRHTTRHVELFDLGNLSLLADTPGFMQPALACQPAELIYCFPEAAQKLNANQCQFHNCLHLEEPGCVVRGDWERYEHYCLFLEEVQANAEKLYTMAAPDRSLKSKSGTGGKTQQEPRLKQKRDRKVSRRTEHQELKSDCADDLHDPEQEDS